jgi:predicted permease
VKNIAHDLRYGVRMLFKQPAFSIAAVLVLSLGIGASTAMFGVINALLLKPLLIDKAEQIVGVYSRNSQKPDDYRAFSYPEFAELREQNSVFTSLTAHNLAMVGVADGDSTRRTFADIVPANYFQTFGVPLYRGRPFTTSEEQPGSQVPVAIVSYSYLKKQGGSPDLLGKTLQINGRALSIVGITAQGFTGTTAAIDLELYLPMGMYEAVINDFEGKVRPLAQRDNRNLILIGRLKPGVSLAQADTALAVNAARMAKESPADSKDQQLITHRLSRMSVSTRPMSDASLAFPTLLLLAMAGIVLLIASLNVANMMLVRATARRREVAVRLALGASRRNIVQQLFTEGMVLAFAGGIGGSLLAYAGTTLLLASMARVAPINLALSSTPDLRVISATFGFCILSAILFSLAPARTLRDVHIVADIKEGESRENSRLGGLLNRRNLLVGGQLALSLMLLTAAGLFLRSSIRAASVEPGFNTTSSILIELDPSLAAYDEAHGRQLYRQLLERVHSIPSVQSAALAATVPFGMISLGRGVERLDAPTSAPASKAVALPARYNLVTADYFATLRIPLLQGRTFRQSESDPNSAPVAILDQLAAERLWPNTNPVGQRIKFTPDSGTHAVNEAEVVGIVGNVQENVLGQSLEPHVYLSFGQEYQADMTIHLVSSRSDAALLEDVRREVRLVDSRMPILYLKTMRSHIDQSFGLWIVRTGARLFSIFGATALLLAMVGLFGLRAYTVARRTREIGVRMALGARPRDAERLILSEGIKLTIAGTAVGLALSLLMGKLLSSLLYRVSGVDPAVLVSATATLCAVSLLACYLPARRAARIDPMLALRHD